jgi:hypothetical protein
LEQKFSKEILGHKTLQMVHRYTHLLNDHKLKAVECINSLGLEEWFSDYLTVSIDFLPFLTCLNSISLEERLEVALNLSTCQTMLIRPAGTTA